MLGHVEARWGTLGWATCPAFKPGKHGIWARWAHWAHCSPTLGGGVGCRGLVRDLRNPGGALLWDKAHPDGKGCDI
jgi:hypothetical protein